jgi:hypothetical protein
MPLGVDICVLAYLLLSQLHGELQTIEMHAFAMLKRGTCRIVVEQHLQFVRGACVVEESCREVLALSSQLHVFILIKQRGWRGEA